MRRYKVIDTDCEADVWFDNVENRPLDYKDIEKILEKQCSQWQKLKEWLEEQQNNFKLISKTLGKADYVLLSNCIKSVLSEMAKLEGEDVKD